MKAPRLVSPIRFRRRNNSKKAQIYAGMLCCLILGGLVPLHAQNGRTPANSSPPLDATGAKQQPDIVRPHWREELERKGITIAIEDIYDFQGNPSGGRTQMGTVFGRSTGSMTLDLQKLLSWQDASVIVSGIFQTGSDLATTYIGSWDFTSSIAGTHTLRFNEYYLQQKLFHDKLTLRMGQIDAQNEFDNQVIGADDPAAAFKTWINNSLCCNVPTTIQTYASFSPAGKPGFFIRGDPTKHVFYKLAVLSSPHSPFVGDPSGIRFDLRNAPDEASTFGYLRGDDSSAHPGVYKIGQVHNFGHFNSFISHKPSHGNDEYFVDVGQALWRRKVGGHYVHQGVDYQFSISATPRRLNVNDWETLTGIRLVGLTYKRPADIVAIGVINSHFSRDYSEELAFGSTWSGLPDNHGGRLQVRYTTLDQHLARFPIHMEAQRRQASGGCACPCASAGLRSLELPQADSVHTHWNPRSKSGLHQALFTNAYSAPSIS